MTQEISHRQQFAVSIETYWRELCLSLEYQERLYCEALGCERMQIVELAGDYEKGMKRILRFTKPIDAPAAITKLFGSHVTIEEHSQYDAREQCWSYRMVPSMMADRIDIRGRVRIVPQTGSIEQHSHNTVSCKLFGLGSIIEHFVAKSTEQGNADKAAFTRRYIEEKKLR
ncbi:MAG: hypothetical protein JWN48_1663 [Myxococcaceae bacterium]|nr:hypothetical protein [Myxococcaceae bacterium]